MRPVLLELALGTEPFTVRAYGTFMTLAWITAVVVAAVYASRRHLPWKRVLFLFAVSLAVGIVGARVLDLFVAADFYAEEPARVWSLSFAGFSLYGGLLGATAVAIDLTRHMRLPLWRVADAAVPGLVTGIVLMRTGCFLNGCCYGHVTEMPWGVRFPAGSYAWAQQMMQGQTSLLTAMGGSVQPVHPTQLYEMAAAVGLGVVALLIARSTRSRGLAVPDGVPFLVFAIGFTAFRFANGFLREQQPVITAPDWFYPAFYSAAIVILLALLAMRLRGQPYEHASAALEPTDGP